MMCKDADENGVSSNAGEIESLVSGAYDGSQRRDMKFMRPRDSVTGA